MRRVRRPTVLRRHPADGEILRLGLPALGALVAEPLFLLADSAIVGHLGTPQLAGLGIAGTVLATLVNLSIFLAYGTTAAVARMLGAGDLRGAMRQGMDGCWLALLIGVVTLIAGLPELGCASVGYRSSGPGSAAPRRTGVGTAAARWAGR